jgi:hypothetical protein
MAKKSRKKDVFELEGGETWLNRTWRPAAAVVYLLICLFDFIVAPAFMGFKSATIAQMAASVKGLDPTIATALINARTPWEPLTLQGSGLFHVAFGAILGVAAWTRGAAQIEQVKQQGENERSPFTPTPVTTYYPPAYVAQQPTYQPQPYQQMPVQQPSVPVQNNPSDMGTGVDNPDAEPDKY